MELNFQPAEIFRGTTILRQADNLAYAYETSHAAADADGAPNAYHPGDLGKHARKDAHIGLDALANAGYPNTDWWDKVLAANPDDPSRPYVQQRGATKGFFVAMTALRKPGGASHDIATYVDSTRVPYVVIPTGFEKLPHVAKMGDVGLATDCASGRTTEFIVADAGGGRDAKLGEASLALYAALGYAGINPRTGKGLPLTPIHYLLFPGSRRTGSDIWPRSNHEIAAQVQGLLVSTPGIKLL